MDNYFTYVWIVALVIAVSGTAFIIVFEKHFGHKYSEEPVLMPVISMITGLSYIMFWAGLAISAYNREYNNMIQEIVQELDDTVIVDVETSNGSHYGSLQSITYMDEKGEHVLDVTKYDTPIKKQFEYSHDGSYHIGVDGEILTIYEPMPEPNYVSK